MWVVGAVGGSVAAVAVGSVAAVSGRTAGVGVATITAVAVLGVATVTALGVAVPAVTTITVAGATVTAFTTATDDAGLPGTALTAVTVTEHLTGIPTVATLGDADHLISVGVPAFTAIAGQFAAVTAITTHTGIRSRPGTSVTTVTDRSGITTETAHTHTLGRIRTDTGATMTAVTDTASITTVTADAGENPCARAAVTTVTRYQPARAAVPAEAGIDGKRTTVAAPPTTPGQHRIPAGTAAAVVPGRCTAAPTVTQEQTTTTPGTADAVVDGRSAAGTAVTEQPRRTTNPTIGAITATAPQQTTPTTRTRRTHTIRRSIHPITEQPEQRPPGPTTNPHSGIRTN